jgi:hypothetical protein
MYTPPASPKVEPIPWPDATLEQVQAAAREVAEVCRRHGVTIWGYDDGLGISIADRCIYDGLDFDDLDDLPANRARPMAWKQDDAS